MRSDRITVESKELWKGLEQLTPDLELKERTKQRILQGGSAKPAERKILPVRRLIAACVALALVGSGTVIVYLNGGFLTKSFDSSQEMNNAPADPPQADMTPDEAPMFSDEEATTTTGDKSDGEKYNGGSEKPSGGAASNITGGSAETGEAVDSPNPTQPSAGLLTAKRWDDRLHFSDWVTLLGQDSAFRSYRQSWGINLSERIAVTVRSGQTALAGAKVVLRDERKNPIWTAVSDNTGKAYLFYNAFGKTDKPASVAATYGGKTVEQTLGADLSAECSIAFDGEEKMKSALDLMFVCDTTGSMGDELSYLQVELKDIIQKVKQQNGNIPLRLSVNFYRDHGDEYVVRSFPFMADIDKVVSDLGQQSADGGGDYEEAVEEALADAIDGHEWSDAATAKLLFLVLDAPPHASAKTQMQQLLQKAAEKGIRVLPVTASGIDQATEFLMRSFAVGTGGSYVALTNDSGVGDGHLEPTVGETEVHKLNDLLLEIINDYLKV